MTLSKNQPKPGHLHGTSTNPVKRTGRSDGTDVNRQEGDGGGRRHDGYVRGKNTNPTSRSGSEPNKKLNRGYSDVKGPVPSVTDVSAGKRREL